MGAKPILLYSGRKNPERRLAAAARASLGREAPAHGFEGSGAFGIAAFGFFPKTERIEAGRVLERFERLISSGSNQGANFSPARAIPLARAIPSE